MKRPIAHDRLHRVLTTSPVVLVAAKDEPWNQACTAAWSTTLDFEPPKAILVLAGGQATTKAALKSGVLSINVPDAGMLEIVHGIGTSSGRKINKFERFGLETDEGPETGAPLVRSAVLNLECRILERETELGAAMRKAFDLLPVEIVAGYASPDHFDDFWRFDRGLRLLHHVTGNRFVATGEFLTA